MPVLAASRWAATAQARDQVEIARLSVADVRKAVGSATAEAYLAIITAERQFDVNVRARDTAQAHLQYAQARLASGAGTRLNELRAAQEVASDEARVEETTLAIRRAQEALGRTPRLRKRSMRRRTRESFSWRNSIACCRRRQAAAAAASSAPSRRSSLSSAEMRFSGFSSVQENLSL